MPREVPALIPLAILAALCTTLGQAAVAAWLVGLIATRGDRHRAGEFFATIEAAQRLAPLVAGDRSVAIRIQAGRSFSLMAPA
jgi:hypothetical protein